MPYLEFQDQRRALGPGVLTIGSGTEAAWRIVDHDLAPLHALVTLEREGHAILLSGDPDAPVYVNGTELQDSRAVLKFGDRIRLGRAEFTYVQTGRKASADERYFRDTRRGRVYRLVGTTRIGRDPRCPILIQEPEVSRVHAEVTFRDDRFFLAPVGAAYVLVNHERIHGPTELREGDEVSIGRTVLTFSAETGPYRTSAVADPAAPPAHGVVDKRAGKMQTMYMGAVQARENIRRREHNRVIGIIVVVVVVFTLIWLGILRF